MNSSNNSQYNVQVEDATKYKSSSYLSPKRWTSYALQVREVMLLKPNTILEIGPGNGLVTEILRKMNFKVETLDIDERTGADHVASVTDEKAMEKFYGKFNVVIACQILEHVRYEDFLKAMGILKKVAPQAVISLPHSMVKGKFFYVLLKLPGVRDLVVAFKWCLNPLTYQFNGEHYWELGTRGYSIRKVTDDLRKTGWQIRKQFFNPENPYHYFFVLEKNEN
jgi:hypothetical protein